MRRFSADLCGGLEAKVLEATGPSRSSRQLLVVVAVTVVSRLGPLVPETGILFIAPTIICATTLVACSLTFRKSGGKHVLVATPTSVLLFLRQPPPVLRLIRRPCIVGHLDMAQSRTKAHEHQEKRKHHGCGTVEIQDFGKLQADFT